MKKFFAIFLFICGFCGCAVESKTVKSEESSKGAVPGEEESVLVIFPNQAILTEGEAGRVWYLLLQKDGKIEKHLAVPAPPEFGADALFSFVFGKMGDFKNTYAVILSHDGTRFTNAKGEMYPCQNLEEIDWQNQSTPLLRVVVKVDEKAELELKKVFELGKEELSSWQKTAANLNFVQAADYKFPMLGARLTVWELLARLKATQEHYRERIEAITGIFGGNLAEQEKKEIKQLQEKIDGIEKGMNEINNFIERKAKSRQ